MALYLLSNECSVTWLVLAHMLVVISIFKNSRCTCFELLFCMGMFSWCAILWQVNSISILLHCLCHMLCICFFRCLFYCSAFFLQNKLVYIYDATAVPYCDMGVWYVRTCCRPPTSFSCLKCKTPAVSFCGANSIRRTVLESARLLTFMHARNSATTHRFT